MSRPCKRRRVCAMPDCVRFGPAEKSKNKKNITMTVDEYEAIRLIDLEKLTQAECAVRMNVARTTVQAIYNSAREKLADAVVNATPLNIFGGEYMLCSESYGNGFCENRSSGCRRHHKTEGNNDNE